MSIRRMGIIFGLALLVGSIVSMWLPESETKIEERLFAEITYQMSELKLVTDTLVQMRNGLTGTMQQQIDSELQRAATWLVEFKPTGDTHEARKEYLIKERDVVTQLVKDLGRIKASISRSNIATQQ